MQLHHLVVLLALRLRGGGGRPLRRLFLLLHGGRPLLLLRLLTGRDQGQPLHLMHHDNGVHQLLIMGTETKLVYKKGKQACVLPPPWEGPTQLFDIFTLGTFNLISTHGTISVRQTFRTI